MTGRPRGTREFQRLLQRRASEIGQLPQRVMHLVRVGVVCAILFALIGGYISASA